MKPLLQQAWTDLQFYCSIFAEQNMLQHWVPLSLCLLFIILLTKILTQANRRRLGKDKQISESYKLLLNSLLAYSLTLTALIACYSYLWVTAYYELSGGQALHIISVLLICCIPISVVWQIKTLFRSDRRRDLYRQQLSAKQDRKKLNLSFVKFRKAKRWLLLPALGFLIIPLFMQPNHALISIVLDTSASMSFSGYNGEIPLDNGKNALKANILDLSDPADFIITTFSDEKPGIATKNNLLEITQVNNYDAIRGTTVFFSTEEKNGVLNYIKGIETSGGSPICEAIWNNFLFTFSQSEQGNYSSIVSIIVTDGVGVISSEELPGFFCGNSEYDQFYSNPEQVNIINLSEVYDSPFMQVAEGCGYSIEDGFSASSYLDSLDRILSDFKLNWSLIFWIALIYGLATFACFIITPNLQ